MKTLIPIFSFALLLGTQSAWAFDSNEEPGMPAEKVNSIEARVVEELAGSVRSVVATLETHHQVLDQGVVDGGGDVFWKLFSFDAMP